MSEQPPRPDPLGVNPDAVPDTLTEREAPNPAGDGGVRADSPAANPTPGGDTSGSPVTGVSPDGHD